MSENKEHSTIKEKGPSDIGYHGNQGNASDPQNDDIKQQAGELLKAAGGLAGSLGKLAKKKGIQIKEKLEDEEFQEKISSGIKAVTDKIDDYVTADPNTEKPEVVKVSTDTINASSIVKILFFIICPLLIISIKTLSSTISDLLPLPRP